MAELPDRLGGIAALRRSPSSGSSEPIAAERGRLGVCFGPDCGVSIETDGPFCVRGTYSGTRFLALLDSSAVRHRYPFEALHWLREQRVNRQASALGESTKRAARARSEAAHAEQARLCTEQALAAESAAEQLRLADGLVRAGDLEVLADWQKGAATELAAKLECERRARETLALAAAAEAQARGALAAASNEAKMIDTHRDAFRLQRAKAQELCEDEAAAEQWAASHYLPRRS
jgi:hypothetical protein